MSSSDRRTFLLGLATLPLAGCGFQPAYGTGGTAQKLRGRVLVDEPSDRNGFNFVARLEDRLGRAQAPAYRLSYTITTKTDDLAITSAQEITRYNVIGKVRYSLTDTETGAVVTSGHVDSFTGYSATGTTVSTLVAERDAYERLMVILADQIMTRLIAASTAFPA